MTRGEVYDVDWPGLGRRPAVIITRPTAIPYLANVAVALITTRVRELPTEVRLGAEQGLVEGSVVNADNLLTIPKTALARHRGTLGPVQVRALDDALRVALALD